MRYLQRLSRTGSRTLAGVIAFGLGLGCGDDEVEFEIGDAEFAIGLWTVDPANNFEANLFVVFTDDIDSGSVDLSNALEVGGSGFTHGLPGTGEFYTTRQESSEITKYRVEDGVVREAGRLLLTDLGVRLFAEEIIFDGPDRGYLFDLLSSQIVELDLESMQIIDTIDASALRDPTQPTFVTANEEVRRGDEVVLATYALDNEQETVSDLSQIVFFNPSTGALERKTAPCGGLAYVTSAENGDIFFANDPWGALVYGIRSTQGPAPCMVRLPVDSRDPDATPIALNDLTGRPTGGIIRGDDSSIFVRVLDTESFPITDETTANQLYGQRAWETFEVDLSRPDTASPVPRANLATGGITYFEVDGEVYESQSTEDFGSTTMLRVTGPGAPAAAIQTPGIVRDILRLR